jgi:hypothetical protein
VGIHVAIVVGRSQFDRLIEHKSTLNALKTSLDFEHKDVSLSKV